MMIIINSPQAVCVSILHKYKEQENTNLVDGRRVAAFDIYKYIYTHPCLLLCLLQLITMNLPINEFLLLVGSLIMSYYVINNIPICLYKCAQISACVY
jgi:hypothetical protein